MNVPYTSPMSLRLTRGLSLACIAVALAACATSSYRAPVEERTRTPSATDASKAPAPAPTVSAPAPVDPNANKPGFVTVKPGDTLIRIALDAGQNWRDIARWNNIEKPDMIEAGQVLRVTPPPESTVAARPVAAPKVEARPIDPKAAAVPGVSASAPSSSPGSSVGVVTPTITPAPSSTPSASTTPAAPSTPTAPSAVASPSPAASGAPATAANDDAVAWMWPARGNVGAGFEEPRMKGVAIVGQPGDPVVAAADGKVVYVGSSVRGYGNLVIVKHNATYLTAYGHNRAILVKEDQAVKRGQRIAEMGSSDSERTQLHFEIRRNGVPIDPVKLLPSR